MLFPRRLHDVTDPMSGFFLVRPDAVDSDALRPRGFKTLLELLVRCRALRRAKVAFVFATRRTRESNGSLREGLSYLRSLCELRFGLGRAPVWPMSGVPAVEPLVPLLQEVAPALADIDTASSWTTRRSDGSSDVQEQPNDQISMSGRAEAAGRWPQKMVRYSLVSLVSIAVSQAVLLVTFGTMHWTAGLSNMVACAVATVPSYYLNRVWAWGRRGKSLLWREIVPFWAIAFLGLAFSTWAADFGSTLARRGAVSHQTATMIVMTSALLAFGVLWMGKFAIFNAMLFAERPQPPGEPARHRGHEDLAEERSS
jgi:putative flippase GtrA